MKFHALLPSNLSNFYPSQLKLENGISKDYHLTHFQLKTALLLIEATGLLLIYKDIMTLMCESYSI